MVDRVFIKSGHNGNNIGKKFKVVQRKRSVKNDGLFHTSEYHTAIKNNEVDENLVVKMCNKTMLPVPKILWTWLGRIGQIPLQKGELKIITITR